MGVGPNDTHHECGGCKWVYKPKLKSDGTFERLKARPVAKGSNQKPVIDFYETFSPPVIKPATIRVVLTIALAHNVDIRQLNVKNACLRGSLTRPVYMEQPSGFKDPAHPTFVCRLKRAPYGPRQAPRAWFNRFNTYLLTIGFFCCIVDYLYLYVMDRSAHYSFYSLWVILSSHEAIRLLLINLSNKWAMSL